jgi:hypothetical protein
MRPVMTAELAVTVTVGMPVAILLPWNWKPPTTAAADCSSPTGGPRPMDTIKLIDQPWKIISIGIRDWAHAS